MKINQKLNYIIALFFLCLLNEVSFSQTIKTLSYDVEQLSNYWITPLMLFYNIYPDTTIFSRLPDHEIVLALNEEFIVELTNCSIKEQWNYGIEDSVMKLIQCDTMITDSITSLSYKFCALKSCKGCIVFYNAVSRNGCELIIEYTCNPVDSLELNLTHEDWLVDTTSTASFLSLYLSGQTNASKLKVENYGDGVRMAVTIYPENNGNFSDTVGIAFSYDPMHQHIPISNTRIALYGAIGFPKILTLLYSSPTSVNEKDKSQVLKRFDLCQNYPNPFNPTTTISFNLPSRSFVSLKVFNLLGREVATIVSEELSEGKYLRQWKAGDMASGVYFYRLQAGSFTETKKLLLLK
jgi:hypothetical protein